MAIATSRITQPSQFSGINISNLATNATINVTPLTNLLELNIISANNNINSANLNFNNFPNIKSFSSEGSARSESNPGIYVNITGTNSSVQNYAAVSSKVTSLILKNPTNISFPGVNSQIGQIPTGLTDFNIQENGLGGQDLASIVLSFSGLARENNITGGYLNIIPADATQTLTLQQPNKNGYYRELWSSESGEYQLAALLNDGTTNDIDNPGNIFLSTDYGISFNAIFTGLTNVNFRSVAASNNLDRIVAVGRDAFAYMSTDGGATYSIINTGIRTGVNNYTDVAMSSNGQYIILTTNGNAYPYTAGYAATYISNNYGATFTSAPIGLGGYSRFVNAAMSKNGQYQFVAADDIPPYIYRSSNYGVTWGIVAVIPDVVDIATSSDGRYVFVTSNNSNYYEGGIHRSTDYGATWTLIYRDFVKILNTNVLNTDWRGGISVSSNGRYLIAGLTRTRALVSVNVYDVITGVLRYTYRYVDYAPGYLLTSSDYGATWQKTSFLDNWGSCGISGNGKHMLAGSRSGRFYTSRTDGADTVYGTYFLRAYNAVQYLRNIKNWTVLFIKGFFGI